MLAALSVPQILIGMYVARPAYVEDQLTDQPEVAADGRG